MPQVLDWSYIHLINTLYKHVKWTLIHCRGPHPQASHFKYFWLKLIWNQLHFTTSFRLILLISSDLDITNWQFVMIFCSCIYLRSIKYPNHSLTLLVNKSTIIPQPQLPIIVVKRHLQQVIFLLIIVDNTDYML